MTINPEAPDDMTELYDARIDRVDLVGSAANGTRFLLAKSANPGLVPADTIRALLKGTDTEEYPAMAEEITAPAEAEPIEKDAVDAEQQPETDVVAPEPVEKSADEQLAEVAKADGLIAVYDATGCLVGVVKPNAITPVEGPGTTDPDDDGDSVEDADGDGDGLLPEAPAADADVPLEEAAAADVTAADGANQIDGAPADEAPVEEAAADAPAADDEDDEDSRVIPGTHTVQAPVTKEADTAPETDIAAVLKEYLAPLAEKLAKAAELEEAVGVLKEQVEKFGAQPDDRNLPRFHGATGSNAGAAPRNGDAQDALEPLKKALADAEASGNPAAIHKAKADYLSASVYDRFTRQLP